MNTQARFYNQKLFICGNTLELYSYSRDVLLGGQSRIGSKRSLCHTPKPRTIQSLSRAKKQIRRLVNSNPGMNKFLTLTFAENVTDLKQANYEFKKFKQKLERHTKSRIKYLCVPEFQRRGAVHYHLMLEMPFIPWQKLSAIWGHGRIQIEEIRDKHKTGSYISKYITKDKTDLRYFGRKIFFYSRKNLVKCVQTVNNWVIDTTFALMYNRLKLMKTYTCDTQYRGNITINFFQLC